MLNKTELYSVLNEAAIGLKQIFGDMLKAVILFGSYARGDFNRDSDVDIAVLLDMPRTDISAYKRSLIQFSSDLAFKYDILTSFRCIPCDEYERWKHSLPFYLNIEREGVKIIA